MLVLGLLLFAYHIGTLLPKNINPCVSKMAGCIYIGEVNELGSEQFVWIFANVVESYKEAAIAVAEKIPFKNVGELSRAFSDHLENLSKDEKLKILCLHPDLAGRLADTNTLTEESTREQKSAELNTLDPERKAKINLLNHNYRSKFGFPFVICARENKANVIMDQLEVRYKNSLDEEINIGINEVKKITNLRILDLVVNS